MRTPIFKLSQTDCTLQITIKAPYANVAQTEVDVNDNEFLFSSPPYFLRLHLPGSIEETDSSTGKYDSDSGSFYFEFSKKNKNEYFPHLELIGSFLTPKTNKPSIKPSIEVLASVNNESDEEVDQSDEEDDWLLEQTLPQETEALLPTVGLCGFANQIKGALKNFPSEELAEVFDLSNPDDTTAAEKMKQQKIKEQTQFDEDYYLADLMDPPELLQAILTFVPDWSQNEFTEENMEMLKNFGNKEYLLSHQEEKAVFFSLVDILFAFAYDHRTTEGSHTTESAWTINKLSATLSWLRSFSSLKEVIVSCLRRSLCYPLYRHWDLSALVLKDVINIIASGQTQIVKTLLKVYSMFQESEPRYLLNQLYIKDYIIWVQKVPDAKLSSLQSSLELLKFGKEDIELELEELEHAAYLLEKQDVFTIVNNMNNLCLCDEDTSSSAYDSSDTSESSEEDSSSYTDRSTFVLGSNNLCASEGSADSEYYVDSDDYISSSENDE